VPINSGIRGSRLRRPYLVQRLKHCTVASGIGKSVLVEIVEERTGRLVQVALQTASVDNQAAIGVTVEAFDDVHMRLQCFDQIAEPHFSCIACEPNTATLALGASYIAELGKAMDNLHQVIA